MSSSLDPATAHRDLTARYTAFVAEQWPFAVEVARRALEAAIDASDPRFDGGNAEAVDALRPLVEQVLRRRLAPRLEGMADRETTPGVTAAGRMEQATDRAAAAIDGFLRREAIARSLTIEERREALRGMIVTRALDNGRKRLHRDASLRFDGRPFAGTGLRSLGQEAIYAACLRLRRGGSYSRPGGWRGDVVAPSPRDVGAVLAMRPGAAMVRNVLCAQAGKAEPAAGGRDGQVGDFDHGVLPMTSAALAASTVAGLAFAMADEGSGRVAVALVGEGATSLGSWHEAINLCAVRRLPAVFAVTNNQLARSTPPAQQSAVRRFADKAEGYGMQGVTVDGTDPDAVAAAFGWAAERGRAGYGPALVELVAMRMCGHDHDDDARYLGHEPALGWAYAEPGAGGYVDREAWTFWARRDPIVRYADRLIREGVVTREEVAGWKDEAALLIARECEAIIEQPWPADDGSGSERSAPAAEPSGGEPALPPLEPVPGTDPRGETFLGGIRLGVADALAAAPRAFVVGPDVGGRYGDARELLRPLLPSWGHRIHNAPLSPAALIGVAVGAALGGMQPIVELPSELVADGLRALSKSAAMETAWGLRVPIVVRLPWGGSAAGTPEALACEAWLNRVPGLKMVAPTTPADARALFAAAFDDPGPVVFLEHDAIDRVPGLAQALPPEPLPAVALGKAALRRSGADLTLVSYGTFVHVVLRVAARLADEDGIGACVLDLRSLAPLDEDALLTAVRRTGKVLVVHEDMRRGGIGESVAAFIQERAFPFLDAPVGLLGARNAPRPYAPSLERTYLPSDCEILDAAHRLVRY